KPRGTGCSRSWQFDQSRSAVWVRSAYADDLRVSDRDVGDCWRCWWAGTDDDDESQRARAPARDGCDESARRDAADRLADDRGGGGRDWGIELDHRGAARVAHQQGYWRFFCQGTVPEWIGFYVRAAGARDLDGGIDRVECGGEFLAGVEGFKNHGA